MKRRNGKGCSLLVQPLAIVQTEQDWADGRGVILIRFSDKADNGLCSSVSVDARRTERVSLKKSKVQNVEIR
jgi:hypothetical protein